jgi:hypothetical protein
MPDSSSKIDPTPTPRWVKIFGIIAIIVAVAFVILHLAGGGPGRHFGH